MWKTKEPLPRQALHGSDDRIKVKEKSEHLGRQGWNISASVEV